MQTNKTLLMVVSIALVTLGTLAVLYAGFTEYRRADYMVSPIVTVESEDISVLRDKCFNMAQTDQLLNEMLFGTMATDSASSTPAASPIN